MYACFVNELYLLCSSCLRYVNFCERSIFEPTKPTALSRQLSKRGACYSAFCNHGKVAEISITTLKD